MHIWLGTFESEEELEKYLDQKKYLEAWATYDHEPPTGKAAEDAEPSPELRCDFCKEVGLDTYDEDHMVIKYYPTAVDLKTAVHDLILDQKEVEALCEKHKFSGFNTLIAYENPDLKEKAALRSRILKYIGEIGMADDEALTESSSFHYLWVGDTKLDKKNILKQAGIDKAEVVKLNYYHADRSAKLDEILILQVEDYQIAEEMILKVEEMKLLTTNSMLDILVKGSFRVDGERIADVLGMQYIGKFASH